MELFSQKQPGASHKGRKYHLRLFWGTGPIWLQKGEWVLQCHSRSIAQGLPPEVVLWECGLSVCAHV